MFSEDFSLLTFSIKSVYNSLYNKYINTKILLVWKKPNVQKF
jgi:hypothetical protein